MKTNKHYVGEVLYFGQNPDGYHFDGTVSEIDDTQMSVSVYNHEDELFDEIVFEKGSIESICGRFVIEVD